jgi:Protein of unknown function (DUF4058)
MDPYLERYWGDVHTRLMVYASNQLNPQLPSQLRARVEEGATVMVGGKPKRTIYPDVSVIEEPVDTYSSTTTSVEIADPLVIALDDPGEPRHIEIIDTSDVQRIVTVIEFISPSNKTGSLGKAAYRRKQIEYLESQVNLVEVDLIRQGEYILAFPENRIPKDWRTTYQICVRRTHVVNQAELYRVPLRESLPNIRIPLRPTDNDVILQIQPLIDDCYRDGGYGEIEYDQQPDPPFNDDDTAWAQSLIEESRKK